MKINISTVNKYVCIATEGIKPHNSDHWPVVGKGELDTVRLEAEERLEAGKHGNMCAGGNKSRCHVGER